MTGLFLPFTRMLSSSRLKSAAVLAEIKLHKSHVRGELGHAVRFQLRHVPELEFFIDDSLDYIEKIDTLLK